MPKPSLSKALFLIITLVAWSCMPPATQAGPESLDGVSLAPGSAELLAESPFTQATFNYSTQPDKMLVFVSFVPGYGPRTQLSVGLFGDGRLVFKEIKAGKTIEETVQLTDGDLESILRLVVNFGLAEWDMTRVRAQQLEKNNGNIYGGISSDSTHTTVLISLENYRRGTLALDHLEAVVRFQGPFQANELYPPILEIRGIVELSRLTRSLKGKDKDLK